MDSKGVLVSCGADGYVRFWDVKRGVMLCQKYAYMKPGEALRSLACDDDEEHLFVGDATGCVKVMQGRGESSFVLLGLSRAGNLTLERACRPELL